MSESMVIQRDKLERWKKLLDDEPSAPGDGISTIRGELSDMIFSLTNTVKAEGVKTITHISEVEIGKVYTLPTDSSTKAFLQGKPVKVVEKKRSNVVATLEENAGSYKKGQRFSIAATTLVIPKEDK